MSFEPNKFGLYDLSGNVCQWCEDKYNLTESLREVRGGSWIIAAGGRSLLSSSRYSADFRNFNGGFRCVLIAGGGSAVADKFWAAPLDS